MIDLFGLSRGAPQEPQSPQPPQQDAPEPASRGSHRLWAFLLVLDSIFVIVFGGAVAAKAYQYWRTPSLPPPLVAHRRPAPKPAETPKPVEPVAPPAPAAKPAAPAKAPEPEPVKPAKRGDAPRPPKPSMLNEPPKPRAMPSPATAAAPAAASAASPAAPAGAASTKAQPVVFKLRADDAKTVQLVGAFIVRGGRKEMT
jgi:outer membrane biosynthesis protein TonB